MAIGLIDAAHIFRERDNVLLKQELAKKTQEADLAHELLRNPLLRAVVSIVQEDKRVAEAKGEWWVKGCNVTRTEMEAHLGGIMWMWEAPKDWCRQVTPFLQRIGYDVVLYSDASDTPMYVRWHDTPRSHGLIQEELEDAAAWGWEVHPRAAPAPR